MLTIKAPGANGNIEQANREGQIIENIEVVGSHQVQSPEQIAREGGAATQVM